MFFTFASSVSSWDIREVSSAELGRLRSEESAVCKDKQKS